MTTKLYCYAQVNRKNEISEFLHIFFLQEKKLQHLIILNYWAPSIKKTPLKSRKTLNSQDINQSTVLRAMFAKRTAS